MKFVISGRAPTISGGETNILTMLAKTAFNKANVNVDNAFDSEDGLKFNFINGKFIVEENKVQAVIEENKVQTIIEAPECEDALPVAKEMNKALKDFQAKVSDLASVYGGVNSPFSVYMKEEEGFTRIGVDLKEDIPEDALTFFDHD